MRLRLDFSYDGTDFSGWARQPGLRTVEEELATALGTIFRSSNPPLTVGGRTDAGVHARGAVAHLDIAEELWERMPGRSERSPAEAVRQRLGGVLPEDIIVRSVTPVDDAFDARFSALRRRYTYRIADRPYQLDPLRRRDTVRHRRPLDVAAMNHASSQLTGLHDFAAFCRRREGATTVRTLLDYRWARDESGIIVGTVVADAFCHSMVRALVGGIIPVGEGRKPIEWPAQVLRAGVRDAGVQVMPARGLCLEEIVYPQDAQSWAQRSEESRALRQTPDAPGGVAR